MERVWWIYDEEDPREPGWQRWRALGAFLAQPAGGAREAGAYVLGWRPERSQAAWMAWLIRPSSGSLHRSPSAGGWGRVHRRLLGPLPDGLPERWVCGLDAMELAIAEAHGGGEHLAHLRAAEERSRSAPSRWGGAPSPAWLAAMAEWEAGREAAWGGGEQAGLGERIGSLARQTAFLRALAAGASSPAQEWLAQSASMPEARRERAALVAARMQAVEIAQGLPPGPGPLKARRI